jgi:hypothetical protein
VTTPTPAAATGGFTDNLHLRVDSSGPLIQAIAGTPGTFNPTSGKPPSGDMPLYWNDKITAVPTTEWTVGQYVEGQNGDDRWWTGTAWDFGRGVGFATSANSGTPGWFPPANSHPPQNLAELQPLPANPTTAWLTGEYVTTGDGNDYYWNGTAWVAGMAP